MENEESTIHLKKFIEVDVCRRNDNIETETIMNVHFNMIDRGSRRKRDVTHFR